MRLSFENEKYPLDCSFFLSLFLSFSPPLATFKRAHLKNQLQIAKVMAVTTDSYYLSELRGTARSCATLD